VNAIGWQIVYAIIAFLVCAIVAAFVVAWGITREVVTYMDNHPEEYRIPFGKHEGKTLGQIVADDPGYFDYLADVEIRSKPLREAVEKIREKYAAEIARAVGEDD
jgi:hypothetical protein